MNSALHFPKSFALIPTLSVFAFAGTGFIQGAETPAETENTGTRAVFSVFDDNDFFCRWSDKYYTNHTRLALTLGTDAEAGKNFIDPWFFALGQEMYTPKDRAAEIPDPRDHPYAAYLYVSAGRAFYDENFLTSVELQIGVTGDWALGEQIQHEYHGLIDEIKPAGWDTQIHRRVVGQLVAENRVRFDVAGKHGNGDFGADLILHDSADLGNLRGTYSIGGEFRYGWNLPLDFGVADLRRSPSVVLDPQVPASVYGFVDLQADAIFWDKTLTGNNDRGADIYAYPLAAQLSIGICAIYDRWMLSFFQTFRTKDFSSQDYDFFAFGGFKLSVFF